MPSSSSSSTSSPPARMRTRSHARCQHIGGSPVRTFRGRNKESVYPSPSSVGTQSVSEVPGGRMKYDAWIVAALLQELFLLAALPPTRSQRTHARQGIGAPREPPTLRIPAQGTLLGKEVRSDFFYSFLQPFLYFHISTYTPKLNNPDEPR